MKDTPARILAFIRQYTKEHGYSPSFGEIQRGLDISSKSVVSYNLGKLERAGYLTRGKGLARTLVVTE